MFQIHPLQDPRWADLVSRHPRASVFHSVPWLKALRDTYGFEPVALTTAPPGAPVADGLVLCRVKSWLTGRRLVSLPFSDHCEPLLAAVTDAPLFVSAIERLVHEEKPRYVEVRAASPLPAAGLGLSTETYCFHQIDLDPALETLYANCHKSSTQRKILRAEREGLICEAGRSGALLDAFWNLFLMTRRKHGVPPQPKPWFRNLIACFGEALQIRVARKDRQPVAAILTLRHRDTLVYKYGCSDPRYQHLGGTQLLFWKAIEQAKSEAIRVFDLGRTEPGNEGLITFKDRWGATRSTLTYSRFSRVSSSIQATTAGPGWIGRAAKRTVPLIPDRLFELAGRVLYRHIA